MTALLGLGLASPAWATIDNLKSYEEAYPGKEPKTYSCKVCHEGAVGKKGALNAYGAALQKFKTEADAKKLTVDDYREELVTPTAWADASFWCLSSMAAS